MKNVFLFALGQSVAAIADIATVEARTESTTGENQYTITQSVGGEPMTKTVGESELAAILAPKGKKKTRKPRAAKVAGEAKPAAKAAVPKAEKKAVAKPTKAAAAAKPAAKAAKPKDALADLLAS